MTHDEYLELVEAARIALSELLRETEPGTGMKLHAAYRELKDLAAERPADLAAGSPAAHEDLLVPLREIRRREQEEQEEHRRQEREHKQAWRRVPMVVRESIVLEALADQRLSVWELWCHLINTRPETRFDSTSLRAILRRLTDAGEPDRVDERRPPAAGRVPSTSARPASQVLSPTSSACSTRGRTEMPPLQRGQAPPAASHRDQTPACRRAAHGIDGEGRRPRSGDDVLEELANFISSRLLDIPMDDPLRPYLVRFRSALAPLRRSLSAVQQEDT